MKSVYLQELPQYHFKRNDFVDAFKTVFWDDEIFEIEVACREHRHVDDFLLYYDDGEFYIIHLKSGTIINWYKHLGRTNTCNKEAFSIYHLIELLKLLKECMKWEGQNGNCDQKKC